MITTVYGYYVMEAGDLASVWMPDISSNFNRISGHSHNGTDSVLLTPAAISKYTSAVSGASWGSDLGGGRYKQTITVPAAILEFNSYDIFVYITSTGERIYPTVIRASATTFDIYSTDNTLGITIVYG